MLIHTDSIADNRDTMVKIVGCTEDLPWVWNASQIELNNIHTNIHYSHSSRTLKTSSTRSTVVHPQQLTWSLDPDIWLFLLLLMLNTVLYYVRLNSHQVQGCLAVSGASARHTILTSWPRPLHCVCETLCTSLPPTLKTVWPSTHQL